MTSVQAETGARQMPTMNALASRTNESAIEARIFRLENMRSILSQRQDANQCLALQYPDEIAHSIESSPEFAV
jgi:hypothetical protein